MNPRQRRGVFFMVVAGGLAVVVFAWVIQYVATVRREVGSMVTVLRLDTALPAFAAVGADTVEAISIPARWAPSTAVHNLAEVGGQVTASALRKGTYLESDMLTAPPQLQPGQREIAVLVNAETGVAGQIARGSSVDVYATFSGSAGGSGGGDRAVIVVAGARIVNVGNVESITGSDSSGGVNQSQLVPVTFALSPADALAVIYAESFAAEFRLALIGSGDTSVIPPDQRSFGLQDLPAPPAPSSGGA